MTQDKLDKLFTQLRSLGIRLALDEHGGLVIRGDKKHLTPDLVAALKSSKNEIVQRLKAGVIKRSVKPIIQVSRDVDLPLSYAQQRMWLLDKIDGGSAHYHIPVGLNLQGELHIGAFENALRNVLERHEILRTRIVELDGQPVLQFGDGRDFELRQVDLSQLTEEQQKVLVCELARSEASAPFDLSADLMLRASLLKLNDSQNIALVTMHHIASDGWSSAILIREFSELYSAELEGRAAQLPPLQVQYADYAHWQRGWLQGERLELQLGYWQRQLAGIPGVHSVTVG